MGLFGDKNPQPAPQTPTPTPGRPAQSPTSATTGITIVAQSSRMAGKLSGSADIHVAGSLEGEVDASGQLIIAESGRVAATLHARVIIVAGSVKGDVSADEKIQLKPSAKLHGNITAPRILIEEGATFEGQVFMKSPEGRPDGKAKGAEQEGRKDGGKEAKGAPNGQSQSSSAARNHNR